MLFLQVISAQHINDTKINPNTVTFLTKWGLPFQAAPFLSFDEFCEGILPSVEEVFKIDSPNLNSLTMFGQMELVIQFVLILQAEMKLFTLIAITILKGFISIRI